MDLDTDPRDILLQVDRDNYIHAREEYQNIQIAAKKNIPGNLREEIKKFVEFAEDRVIKHQVGSLAGFLGFYLLPTRPSSCSTWTATGWSAPRS